MTSVNSYLKLIFRMAVGPLVHGLNILNNKVYFIDLHLTHSLSVLVLPSLHTAPWALPYSGVPQGRVSNPPPSDHGATTLPTELSLPPNEALMLVLWLCN